MERWDVFQSDRLEVQRGLTTDEVRAALARGQLRDDDLVRPAGTTIPWARLAEMPALLVPTPAPPVEAAEVEEELLAFAEFPEDDEEEEEADAPRVAPALVASDVGLSRLDIDPLIDSSSKLALPVGGDTWDDDEADDPLEEDEAVAEFTLSRSSAETVEELDLAAMVDVAFQLVLFFLVTATTVLYKSLEVPKPNPETPPAASAKQGRSRSLDDLKNDYILVEIDPAGAVKLDHEPIAPTLANLVERLRSTREKTGRKAMLLSADFSTPHRNAVMAYDAANEIGLGIAIARPQQAAGANPAPAPVEKK